MTYGYEMGFVESQKTAATGKIVVTMEPNGFKDEYGFRVFFPNCVDKWCADAVGVDYAVDDFVSRLREVAFTAQATRSGEDVMFCSGLGFPIPLDEAWEIARGWNCGILVVDGIDGKTVECRLPENKFIVDGCNAEKVREILAGL